MKPKLLCFCAITFFNLLDPFSSTILTATYENEKLLCNKTEAISWIQKIPVDGPYGKDYRFKIGCVPLNICNETCEWSDRCTVQHYGNGVYLGGILSLYYVPTGERYLALLCCNSTGISSNCKSFNNYTSSSYVISTTTKEIIHQVQANHRPEGKPWLTVEMCHYNASKNNSCPPMAAALARGAENVNAFGFGKGLEDLAGLTGLVALAFVGAPATTPTTTTITTTTPTTTTPCITSIDCVNVFCNYPPVVAYFQPTAADCEAQCLADPSCVAWAFADGPFYFCGIYYDDCAGQLGFVAFPGTNFIFCVKNPACTTIT